MLMLQMNGKLELQELISNGCNVINDNEWKYNNLPVGKSKDKEF